MKKEPIFQAILSSACLVNAIGFVYLWLASIEAPKSPRTLAIQQALKNCEFCHNSADAISYAAQLGRLDFVAMSLTILGVVIALAGFYGFWAVHREAMATAQDTAKDVAKKETNEYLKSPEYEDLVAKHILQYATGVYKNKSIEEPSATDSSSYEEIAKNIDKLPEDNGGASS